MVKKKKEKKKREKWRQLTAPLNAYATARLISTSIDEIGDDFPASDNLLPWNLSCSSSPLVKSWCLIIEILAIVAMAARKAFKINTVLKPFVYPFSRMISAVDDGMPRVEGEANEDGLLIIFFIKAEGRARLCIVNLIELLL